MSPEKPLRVILGLPGSCTENKRKNKKTSSGGEGEGEGEGGDGRLLNLGLAAVRAAKKTKVRKNPQILPYEMAFFSLLAFFLAWLFFSLFMAFFLGKKKGPLVEKLSKRISKSQDMNFVHLLYYLFWFTFKEDMASFGQYMA